MAGADIPGANTSQYVHQTAKWADNGATYTVKVTDSTGTITSSKASLDVKISETFDESNRTGLTLVTDSANYDYYFGKPWNAELSYNAGRKYPLLIYVHGSGQANASWLLKGLAYMGSDDPSLYERAKSTAFKQKYPCFYYLPQIPSWYDVTKIYAQVERLLSENPQIDSDRIYFTGFSMGGYLAYDFANYYKTKGKYLAGIVRQSGVGQFNDPEIYRRTGVWLHIGLRTAGNSAETSARISDTRAAYSAIKNFSDHEGAVETSRTLTTTSVDKLVHIGNTVELSKGGWEFAKKTEYETDGHFTMGYPYADPAVMEWLFNQSLKKR